MSKDDIVKTYLLSCTCAYKMTFDGGEEAWLGDVEAMYNGEEILRYGLEFADGRRLVGAKNIDGNTINVDANIMEIRWYLYTDRRELDVNEKWAKDAIKAGEYRLDNKLYKIEKEPHGHCTGCDFYVKRGNACPSKAVTICTTGGVIFKKIEEK